MGVSQMKLSERLRIELYINAAVSFLLYNGKLHEGTDSWRCCDALTLATGLDYNTLA